MGLEGLRDAIEHLAAIERSSCSPGEHAAAQWIAAALREQGAAVEVEHERVHGTYWWPLGITSAAGIVAALAGWRGRPVLAAATAALATAIVVDDVGAGHRPLRRILPKRSTANVVATMGDRDAERTLLLVAHHDAAHTGIFYDPRLTRFVGRRLRRGSGEPPRELPLMAPVAVAPLLAGLPALLGRPRAGLIGAAVCAGVIASFVEIARSPTVPGANDNLTGVATLLGVASALRDRPVRGLRIVLLSTGGEEALMDGMWAFANRHFHTLAAERTDVLCIDCVGSPHLVLAEAEGMLRVRSYDARLKDAIERCADEAGVNLRRGVTMRLGTDGYVALRGGVPAATLMSLDEYGLASNYHWPTDTPDRVDYSTVTEAITLCERLVRRLALAPL